jgi:hypothetical protein
MSKSCPSSGTNLPTSFVASVRTTDLVGGPQKHNGVIFGRGGEC